jgi:gephyrin
MTLRAGILVISQTASQEPSTDKAIPALTDVFSDLGGGQWEVTKTQIVPDDVLGIQRTVQEWCDGENPLNLIVTSGGTGFAVKDVTPEVCDAVLFYYCHERL